MRRKSLILVAFLAIFIGSVTTAQATSFWTHLGGDPLVPGGVHTRASLVRLITSHKGSVAMTYAGLSAKERAAVVLAARTGNFRQCTMKYGERFERMSFGINGTSVDRNVVFLDPRFKSGTPAWCINGRVVGPLKVNTIHMLVPFICGNIAVINRTHVRRHGKVYLKKETVVNGEQTTPVAGTFHFKATWKANHRSHSATFTNGQTLKLVLKKVPTGNLVTVREVSIPAGWTPDHRVITKRMPTRVSPAPTLKFVFVNRKTTQQNVSVEIVKQTFVNGSETTPQECGFDFIVTVNGTDLPQVCNHAGGTLVDSIPVGATVKVCEVNIPSGWTPDQTCITQTASSSVTAFTFVNRMTTVTPPKISLRPLQHIFVSGKDQVCATVANPGNHPVNTSTFIFSAMLGSFTGDVYQDPDPTAPANTWCQMYVGPSSPTTDQENTPANCTSSTCETVFVNFVDANGTSLASDSMMFPVVVDNTP